MPQKYRVHDDNTQSQWGDLGIEENVMDRYEPTTSHPPPSHRDQTLKAIVDFRYLAPAKLARDEAHERMLSRLAPLPFVSGNDPSLGSPPLTELVRLRLGAVLFLIGTMLQGAHDVPEAVA